MPRNTLAGLGVACLVFAVPLYGQGTQQVSAKEVDAQEVAFAGQLDRVRKQMNQGRFEKALEMIRTALAEHERRFYVLVRRPEIEEIARQCTFRAKHPPVDPKVVIGGKLIDFDPRTGKIVLEYSANTAKKDFVDPEAERLKREQQKREEQRKKEEAEAEAEAEAERRRGRIGRIKIKLPTLELPNRGAVPDGWPRMIWHPLLFSGPYEIEISGKRHPYESHHLYAYPGIVVMVCTDDKGFCAVEFGYADPPPVLTGEASRFRPSSSRVAGLKPRITRYVGKHDQKIAEAEASTVQVQQPFQLKVKVSGSTIQAYHGSRRLLKVNKPDRSVFGSFGVRAADYDRIVVRGKANPAWIQGLQDEAFQRQWAAFSPTWDARKYLPKWLFEPLPEARVGESRYENHRPEELDDAQTSILTGTLSVLILRGPEKALKHLSKIEDKLPAATRVYLGMICLAAKDDLEGALASCDKLLELAPDFRYGKEVRASLLVQLRRPDEALAQYRKAIEEHPKALYLHTELLTTLIRAGRTDEATQVLRGFLKKHGVTREMLRLQQMLSMIQRGPSWPQTHEYRSKNYIVRSDIDVGICRDAAKVLEDAYRNFQSQLGWVKSGERKESFRVYLFRGQKGYQGYADQVLGDPSPHTAGLYSPSLRQLLIWNLPDRKQMLTTVRHEALHQYLHTMLGDDVPTWLNEGLAEYYELARRRGAIRGGQPRQDHVSNIRGNPLTPFQQFLYLSPRGFYALPKRHYSQAWALVHFLRHGDSEYRPLFRKLMDELKDGTGSKVALRKTFGDVDLKKLQDACRWYVVNL